MTHDFVPESILVYVGGNPDNAIGENVIKLPFLRAIREVWPKARLTWVPGVGPAWFQGALAPMTGGLIDEIVTDLELGAAPLDALRAPRPFPGRRFDLIIDTQNILARTLMLRRVPHDRFISPTWRWFFSDGRPPAELARTPRLALRLLGMLAAASGRMVEPDPVAPLPAEWGETAARLLPDGPVYVGLAPGAGRVDTGKLWPLENFVAVARAQAAAGRVPVFLLGPGEAAWAADLREAVPQAVFPESRTDRPAHVKGPPLVSALAGRLRVGVANCSGTGHLMAAGGCAMVSLFGPTRPEKYAPYARAVTCLRARDHGGTSIALIPVERVVGAVDALIG
ncbi:MAG: glycosyltransferase family 9 protein [Alphaproteobacteria bacterium]|nr:glycosyltransferase family 9 protein [Alphaproteobacteria bacterium]